MGLDSFAYAVPDDGADTFLRDNPDAFEIMYWRKHGDLHDWLEVLYRKRGGKQAFCCPLRLRRVDLLALRKAIKEQRLSPDVDAEMDAVDLEFIARALRYMKEDGYAIFYDSSW